MRDIREYIKMKYFTIALLIAFMLIIYSSPNYAGGLMLFAILVFGAVSSKSRDEQTKLIALFSLVILSIFVLLTTPINYGIDFKGGVRIPLTLEKPVDEQTMSELITKLKDRLSTFGLKQVSVKAIGDSLIYVEVPQSDEQSLEKLQQIIEKQGVYEGIVDGEVVIRGRDIVPGTVGRVPPSLLRGATWGISFTVTNDAAKEFATKVKGKANYPLHMFLDRPKNAVIVISPEDLLLNYPGGDEVKGILAVKEVLLDNELVLDEFNYSKYKGKRILVYYKSKYANESYENKTVFYDLPTFAQSPSGDFYVDQWKAIGLFSSPILNPSVTDGSILQSFTISGSAPTREASEEEAKLIQTILKGGSLPVKVFAGSKTSIPAKLGEQFFFYSFVGLVVSLLAVSVFVSIRYRKLKLIIPIVVITFLEVLILFATMGAFTLDLAAMAGIIAAVGVSIDAQIVITDELLKKGKLKDKLKKAFDIINTNATVIIIAMLPLLFSTFVEVIGFAISTILGALLGALISRPSYAILVENFLKDEITRE